MTKTSIATLQTIGSSPQGLTRSELRSLLAIPRASSNARVSRLIGAGLVLELDPNDGTRNRLYLSEMGKAELDKRGCRQLKALVKQMADLA